jgi:hypothetical protein
MRGRGVEGAVAAFLAAAPTGKPFGLAAPTAARTGGGRSREGVGAGGAPFFLVASGSGACRTASLRDGVGSEHGKRDRCRSRAATMD